jgi:hypothetical protein
MDLDEIEDAIADLSDDDFFKLAEWMATQIDNDDENGDEDEESE